MADKHFVLDFDAFADERMRRDLAERTDRRVLLKRDKGPDLRIVANLASIQVHQIRVVNDDVAAEPDRWRDRHQSPVPSFSRTRTRPLLPQSMRASRSGRERQPSRTNIRRSMSLLRSVMWLGSTSNWVVKSSRFDGFG